MTFPRVRIVHKWISLAFLFVWALQAASGLAISFRADIDDFFLGQAATETDPAAIARTVAQMQADGDDISSIWISGGQDGQFDLYLDRAGDSRTVRMDGAGRLVRDRSDTVLFSDGAVFETLTRFHKSLMLGTVGYAFLTLSGLLLASNILLGLVAGWPQRKRLKAFATSSRAPKPAALSGWHWRIGFWGALPALVIVLSGVALTQADVLADGLGVQQKTPEIMQAPDIAAIPLDQAIETALAEYPGASLVAINLPSDSRPWYRFRLNAPGEMPRLYGATRVFVGLDGAVLLRHDAAHSAPNERITEALYPLHTGQIGGLAGRLLNAATGAWLLSMIILGLQLWSARRRQRATKPAQGD